MSARAPIDIRPLTMHQEFRDAVELQKQIWNFDDVDLLPLRLFVVASKIGGQVLGAYDGRHMIGFCLAIPALKPGGRPYLHSHMLGVLPEYQNCGVGRTLKLRQREDALARSVDLIEWTFDPLEIKNARFNLERLGTIVRRYVRNQYGTTSSPLHGGLPTDRCIAEWWIASKRVQAILSGKPLKRPMIEERISVPADIAEIRRTDLRRIRAIQQSISELFLEHLDRGLAVIGFDWSSDGGTYLLGKWE